MTYTRAVIKCALTQSVAEIKFNLKVIKTLQTSFYKKRIEFVVLMCIIVFLC